MIAAPLLAVLLAAQSSASDEPSICRPDDDLLEAIGVADAALAEAEPAETLSAGTFTPRLFWWNRNATPADDESKDDKAFGMVVLRGADGRSVFARASAALAKVREKPTTYVIVWSDVINAPALRASDKLAHAGEKIRVVMFELGDTSLPHSYRVAMAGGADTRDGWELGCSQTLFEGAPVRHRD